MTEPDNRTVPLRLQKFLARAGVASRRGSENLMTAGRVTVNGVVVTELGSKVDPRIDQVRVDGVPVALSAGPITVMLHKPAGVITTMKDARGRACVADLVPADRYPGLFPIGRLHRAAFVLHRWRAGKRAFASPPSRAQALYRAGGGILV